MTHTCEKHFLVNTHKIKMQKKGKKAVRKGNNILKNTTDN